MKITDFKEQTRTNPLTYLLSKLAKFWKSASRSSGFSIRISSSSVFLERSSSSLLMTFVQFTFNDGNRRPRSPIFRISLELIFANFATVWFASALKSSTFFKASAVRELSRMGRSMDGLKSISQCRKNFKRKIFLEPCLKRVSWW